MSKESQQRLRVKRGARASFIRRAIAALCLAAVIPCAALWFAAGTAPSAAAHLSEQDASASAQSSPDFARDVLPILRRKCLACHSASAAQSDVLLESVEAIRAGGSNGPVVVPGKANESRLILLATAAEEPRMPPPDNDANAEPLTAEELDVLREWINDGAHASAEVGPDAIAFQPLPPGVHAIYATAVTPDGRFAAYGLANQIRMVSVESRSEMTRLTDPALLDSGLYQKPGVAHRDLVNSLAFSPDGRTLASGGYRTIKIWRRLPPRRITEFNDGTARVHAPIEAQQDERDISSPAELLARLPNDGKMFIHGGPDGKALLWSVDDPSAPRREFDHGAAIEHLEVSKGATFLTTLGADGAARMWELNSGKLLAVIAGDPRDVNRRDEAAMALSRWEAILAGESASIAAVEVQLAAAGEAQTAADQAINPAREAVAAAKATSEQSQQQRDRANQKHESANSARQSAVESLEEVNRALADAADDEQLEAAKAQLEAAVESLNAAMQAAETNLTNADETLQDSTRRVEVAQQQFAEAQRLADQANNDLARLEASTAAARERLAELVSLRDAALATLAEQDVAIQSIGPWKQAEFSADEQFLALVNARGDVLIHEAGNGAFVDALPSANDRSPWQSLSFVDDHRLLATTVTGATELWDVTPGFELAHVIDAQSPGGPAHRVSGLAFSPDGKTLAAAGGTPSRGGEIALWSVDEGTLLHAFEEPHTDTVLALAFSPDGTQLASASADRFVKTWDVASGKLLRTLEGHTDHVLTVDWRFDGQALASGGADLAVKIWNPATGETLRTIAAVSEKQVTGLRFVTLPPERGLTNDDLLVITGEGRLSVRRAATGQQVRGVNAGGEFLYALAADRRGQIAIVGGEDGVVRIIDAAAGAVLWEASPAGASSGDTHGDDFTPTDK